MRTLQDSRVLLRDLIAGDIETRVRWETVENEWQLWDAPWEYEQLSETQKADDLECYIQTLHRRAAEAQTLPDDAPRMRYEICTRAGKYIGWLSAYRIDAEGNICEDGADCAVGICLPETAERRKGYAAHALRLFIDELLSRGETTIATQTWSGNLRMLGLAEKLGFEPILRKPGIRQVRGTNYDGLTLRLNPARYRAFRAAQDESGN